MSDGGMPLGQEESAIQDGALVTSDFPQVGMVVNANGSICTGTLIAPDLVLTVNRHELVQGGPNDDPCTSPTQFKVGSSSSNFTTYTVAQAFEQSSSGFQLIKLTAPVAGVTPLEIDTTDVGPAVGTVCTSIGFGDHDQIEIINGSQTIVTVHGIKRRADFRVTSNGANINTDTVTGTYFGTLDRGDHGAPLICNGRVAGAAEVLFTAATEQLFRGGDKNWILDTAADFTTELPAPAVARATNRLDVFTRGRDNAVYVKSWNGSAWLPSLTGNWTRLGGTIVGMPEAASWGPARLDVFVRGVGKTLYHKAWDGVGSPSDDANWPATWTNLGGPVIAGHPAAVSPAANRVDVFGVGADGAVYHRYLDGSGWHPALGSPMDSLGGSTFTGAVKAVSRANGRIDVFAVGGSKDLYTKSFDGTNWAAGWTNLGGDVVGLPAVASWKGSNKIHVFRKAPDQRLFYKQFDGTGWQPTWLLLGTTPTSGIFHGAPAAIARSSTLVDVFGIIRLGFFDDLYGASLNGSAWGAFQEVDSTPQLSGNLSVVSMTSSRVDIFAANLPEGQHVWGSGTSWSSEGLGGIIDWFQ